jgi:hypothetical protein
VVSQDASGRDQVQVNLPVIPGLPGALSADHLSGEVTVKAQMSLYTVSGTDVWGNPTYNSVPTPVELTTSINLPVIDKTGPLLLAVTGSAWGNSTYHLWSDFPNTKAFEADDVVMVHYQPVDGFGVPTGESGSYSLLRGPDQSFSLSLGFGCGNIYAGWYVLRFEIMGSRGVRTLTTQPIYLNYAEPCAA